MAKQKVGDLLDIFFTNQERKFSTPVAGTWSSSQGGMTTYDGVVFVNFTGIASATFTVNIGYNGEVGVILNDVWQTVTFPYAIKANDSISIAFNYTKGA